MEATDSAKSPGALSQAGSVKLVESIPEGVESPKGTGVEESIKAVSFPIESLLPH